MYNTVPITVLDRHHNLNIPQTNIANNFFFFLHFTFNDKRIHYKLISCLEKYRFRATLSHPRYKSFSSGMIFLLEYIILHTKRNGTTTTYYTAKYV